MRTDPRYEPLFKKLREESIRFDTGVKDFSGRTWPLCVDGNFFIKVDFSGKEFAYACEGDDKFLFASLRTVYDSLGMKSD